jgi:hypothetical protein
MIALEDLANRYVVVAVMQVPLLLYMLAYAVIALHTVYAEKWLKTVLKFILLLFLFLPILGGVIELVSHEQFTRYLGSGL